MVMMMMSRVVGHEWELAVGTELPSTVRILIICTA